MHRNDQILHSPGRPSVDIGWSRLSGQLTDGDALVCCRATATRHEGLDLDTDPTVQSMRAVGG
jgi:hypothetical protein